MRRDRPTSEAMAEPRNQSVRLERRLRFALRIVLYPLAVGLIALVWQRTHPQTAAHHWYRPLPPVHWRGQTSQHQAIRLVTAGGRLKALRTFVLIPCDDRSSVGFTIAMTVQDIRRHGDGFRGVQPPRVVKDSTGRARTVRAWARASTTGQPAGRLQATAATANGQVECQARPISFTSRPATS
jgi:hypothetical protein